MLKNKKTQNNFNTLEKKEIIKKFAINSDQEEIFNKYINILKNYNQHTNLVGKSTLINPWKNHILDSLQLLFHIKDKKKSIIDMGTGAGFPGVVLSVMGHQNIALVDSNQKKTRFLNLIKSNTGLNIDIFPERLEKLNNKKFDIITSRALAKVDQLISYSQKFIKKNSVLIFLKGKTVNDEIQDAKKKWMLDINKHKSISDPRGSVIILKNTIKI